MRLVLHEAGIDPRRIVCEVTEQKSASQETLYSFVEALRANGFRIAVDDYGADESDINRIKELKPDIVKFDAHWITQLMESGAGFALLTTMGYDGPAKGLFDAETNLKYAVKYLRGAWLCADGNAKKADWLYQTGYYFDAKRKGLLEATGLGVDRKRRPQPDA